MSDSLENAIRFTIPLHTVSEANINCHWANKKKKQRKKDAHFFVGAYFNSHSKGKQITLPCKVILTRIAPRGFDYDNLVASFKAIRDRLADKIIPGLAPGRADGDERINWEYHQEKGKPNQYAVRVEIFPFSSYFPS